MSSVIVFILAALEIGTAVTSYLLKSQLVFYGIVIYGSPFYLVMNLLNKDSALLDKSPIYIGFIAYHIIKYFIFFRARMVDDRNPWLTGAIILEVIYLGLTAYYVL